MFCKLGSTKNSEGENRAMKPIKITLSERITIVISDTISVIVTENIANISVHL